MTQAPIDFVALAAALLERAEALLRAWLPDGVLRQHYWYVGDFDGSPGKSANVNLRTGAWGDNGRPGDSGRDLISLYGRIKGLSNADAARELIVDNGWQSISPAVAAPEKPRKKHDVKWMPIHPVPADAPAYREQWAHYSRGVPPMHWEYLDREGRLLGITVRFPTSTGGKDVQPISFCQGSNGERAWKYKAFGQPRPLYGLHRLAGVEPGAEVVVLEGEKKADRLYEALGRQVPVLGWPGGCNVVHLCAWDMLRGYRLTCWPDADSQRDKQTQQLLPANLQPGMAAMLKVQAIMAGLETQVHVVDIGPPGTRSDGWDAADAVDEGWTAEQLWQFMRTVLREPDARPEPPAAAGGVVLQLVHSAPRKGTELPTAALAEGGGDPRWRLDYVMQRGSIRECVPNVMRVLHHHPAWRGVLGFDAFAQRIVKRRPTPYDAEGSVATEWVDVDDTRTAAWIASHEAFVPSSGMVAEAANEAAHANSFHPVLQWLRTLRHDGIARIDHWLVDYLGWKACEYTRLVSRYFLIGMCMRVLQPGVKFDYCLVLESPQGKRKSSALRALAGAWFSDIELDLTNKDAMSNIRGKWLHEFGEMGSLARTESNRQKSFLSRQVDEFRPVYGRREIQSPRQTVFAGTTNEWAWNKDPTGGRRFWPGEVGVDEIDVERLTESREQLFAEAFAAAQAGERYWPDSTEQRELFDPEQLDREAPDALVSMLGQWLASPAGLLRSEFSLADALIEGLKLDAKSATRDIQTRVGYALKKLGCEKEERRTAPDRFVYKRPRRNAASSPDPASAAQEAEVPF